MKYEPKTMGEIGIILSNMDATIKEGFKGVHKRQDEANHKVATNRTMILENEKDTKLALLKASEVHGILSKIQEKQEEKRRVLFEGWVGFVVNVGSQAVISLGALLFILFKLGLLHQ